MKRFSSILCFLLSLCACSTLDDSSGDDPGVRLDWLGDTGKFTIDGKTGIRLNDPAEAGGVAFLETPSTQIRKMRWEFGVHLSFNPSANNYARFYLGSSSDVLSGELDGYFLQIGGKKDNLALYRQEGDECVLLAAGRELMKGDNSPELSVRVECDSRGHWTFWSCLDGEEEYVREAQVKEETFTSSVCAGLLCVYTASRCKGFTFSRIALTQEAEEVEDTEGENPDDPDKNPDDPDGKDPEHPDQGENRTLVFNEVMYHNASDGAEYVELYNVSDRTVQMDGYRLCKVREDGSYMSQTLLALAEDGQSLKVPPHGYVCFTESAGVLRKKHKKEQAVLVSVPKFPALNNKGGVLALMDAQGKVLDRCAFSDAMQDLSAKLSVGVSLEKRRPELDSGRNVNWCSSTDVTGGTPGEKNSVM